MSAVPKRTYLPHEYLDLDRAAEFKSEFVDGEIYPMQGRGGPLGMAGARFPHNRVKDNFAFEIRSLLKDGPCVPLTSDMRVKAGQASIYYYPDILIVCDEPQFEDANRDTLLNPQIVIEVLSPSTADYDRNKKFKNYMRIPTLREYILVAQDEMEIDRYERLPNDQWNLNPFSDPLVPFTFATIPVSIPFADIYRGVEIRTHGDVT